MLAELDSGLIGSIRQQAAAEVLSDFVALSRAALDEAGGQGKNVAAVLVAAAFEDSIRRLGAAHAGTVGGEKLAIGGESTSAYFPPPRKTKKASILAGPGNHHFCCATWRKCR
jgi:hypothetical protein